jgi:hypothetical protein
MKTMTPKQALSLLSQICATVPLIESAHQTKELAKAILAEFIEKHSNNEEITENKKQEENNGKKR